MFIKNNITLAIMMSVISPGVFAAEEALFVNNDIIGNYTNSETIDAGSGIAFENNGEINGYYNNGSIFGIISNNGDIVNFENTSAGYISQLLNGGNISVSNAGSIDSILNESTGFINQISNAGVIGNGIINDGSIVMLTNDSEASIDSISNMGEIGSIWNYGNVSEGVTNSGDISSLVNIGAISNINNTESGTLNYLRIDGGAILGDINNMGYIGTILNGGNVAGNIINSGTISEINLYGTGKVTGTILNSGKISSLLNSAYLGDVTNESSGLITLLLNHGSISGDILNDGTVEQLENYGAVDGDIINAGTIDGNIQNYGTIGGTVVNTGVVKGNLTLDTADLVLAGQASVGGVITTTGEIQIGSDVWGAGEFTAVNDAVADTITVSSDSSLTIQDGVNWTATGTDTYSLFNEGTLAINNGTLTGNLLNAGSFIVGQQSGDTVTLAGNLDNQGSIALSNNESSSGTTLIVNGDYNGQSGSKIYLNGSIEQDDSLMDKLEIVGNTSGSSTVYITNVNGAGGSTIDGIQVISVGGASDASFVQGNRVVAGLYDYYLHKGNISGTDPGSWYLSSYVLETENGQAPEAENATYKQHVRPEVGSYTANIYLANTMFSHDFYDRTGQDGRVNGETTSHGLWMHQTGGHTRQKMSDGQNKSTMDRYTLLLGGDLWRGTLAQDGEVRAGLITGYATAKSKTQNALSKKHSTSNIHGYTAGLYASWIDNMNNTSGIYADFQLRHSWFSNSVNGEGISRESYRSSGFNAALEAGYDWRVAAIEDTDGNETRFWLRPHLRTEWMGVKADSHTEHNRTRVQGKGQDNVEFRTGLRTWMDKKVANTDFSIQPYIEANWLHNTHDFGVDMNGATVSAKGMKNVAEVKAGIEGNIQDRLTVWASVGQKNGRSGYSDTQGSLGLRYHF